MPGKRATFTPPGHLCFLMHYPTISSTQVNNIVLRCMVAVAGLVKVKRRLGVRREAENRAPRLINKYQCTW